jgi:hypothetical protein
MNAQVEKICESCGRAFRVKPPFEWQRVCYRCFKGESDARTQLRTLQAENALLKAQLSTLRIAAPTRLQSLDLRRWRLLVSLCHPDKHQNSEVSNETTAWLIEVRDEVQQ